MSDKPGVRWQTVRMVPWVAGPVFDAPVTRAFQTASETPGPLPMGFAARVWPEEAKADGFISLTLFQPRLGMARNHQAFPLGPTLDNPSAVAKASSHNEASCPGLVEGKWDKVTNPNHQLGDSGVQWLALALQASPSCIISMASITEHQASYSKEVKTST